jgi:hypothetical protein
VPPENVKVLLSNFIIFIILLSEIFLESNANFEVSQNRGDKDVILENRVVVDSFSALLTSELLCEKIFLLDTILKLMSQTKNITSLLVL